MCVTVRVSASFLRRLGRCVGKRAVKTGGPHPGDPPYARMGQEQSVVTCPGTGRAARPPAERARGQRPDGGNAGLRARRSHLPLPPAWSPRPAASDPAGIRTKGSE